MDSPNPLLYFVGKGICSFKKTGAADFRDVGNVPEAEFTPTIEKLEHFSSRTGTKKKDRVVVQQQGGTIRWVMEEITAENLVLAVMGGEPEVDTAGDKVISILSVGQITGQWKFIGTNDVGQQIDVLLNNISVVPEAGVNLISDEWGRIEITADVLADDVGLFGTMTIREASTTS